MIEDTLKRTKKLYHGSTVIVKRPNIYFCEKGKDFGQGFYTTTDRKQAIQFVKIKAYQNGVNFGYISLYHCLDLNGLRVFEFPTTDINWFNCIIGNRKAELKYLAQPWEDYDVLMGKVADDNTSLVINAYMTGVYGEINTPNAINTAIRLLEPENLNNQICFKTEKALKKIKFFREEGVSIWQ